MNIYLRSKDDATFLKSIDVFEKTIEEGGVIYYSNTNLTVMKCCFKHKFCNRMPHYTDGKNNYYCWIHAVMVQYDKYK